MGLVIDKLALFFCSFLISELSSTDRIPSCHCSGSKDGIRSPKNNHKTGGYHNLVDGAWVSQKLEFAFTRNFDEPWQETGPWNSIVIEWDVTIINGVIAHFSSNIANFQTWVRDVVYSASYWTEKRLWTVVVSINYHSCKNYSMQTSTQKLRISQSNIEIDDILSDLQQPEQPQSKKD